MRALAVNKGISGLTLLEVVIIVLMVGILAIIAIPVFINFNEDARAAVEQGDVRVVRVGISDYNVESILKKRTPPYPATLDSASVGPASSDNPFFGNILTMTITGNGWTKLNATDYEGHSGTVYHYNNATGTFQ